MGSKSVFLSLQETFPQVDSRILRAVAFEHPKDVNAAAEFVLFEVLTSMSGPSEVIAQSREQNEAFGNHAIACEIDPGATIDPSGGVVDVSCNSYFSGSAEPCSLAPHFTGVVEVSPTSYLDGSEMQCPMMPHQEVAGQPFEPKSLDPKASDCINDAFHLNTCNLDKMVAIPLGNSLDRQNAEPEAASLIEGTIDTFGGSADHCSNDLCAAVQDLNKSEQEETNSISCPVSCYISSKVLENYEGVVYEVENINRSLGACEEKVNGDASTVSTVTCAHDSSLSVHDESNDLSPFGPIVPRTANDVFLECENGYSTYATDKSSDQLAHGIELVSLENDLPVTLTRSGHVVNIDLLEDFVTNARSNKQTLVSSMETVISMVQESHVLEERAKQAKESASRAGQGTLTKVEELKQILKHAKQANDMHAGDIYGEKAILSTEARELQSRLLSLSDERDKSFSIIEEIRQTLEARLAASQDEIAAAEQEKLEMEGLSQKALKEQELVMEMVVEKSKQLQQEAEENAKLRNFLMDRGRVVDTLQGELAVVFEDVMLLKERVEGHLPLTRSLLTAYSSSLSSSSSSQRSISLSNNILDRADLGESPRASRDDQALIQKQDNDSLSNSDEVVHATENHKVSDSHSGEVMHVTENHKVSEDEDWELCNDEA